MKKLVLPLAVAISLLATAASAAWQPNQILPAIVWDFNTGTQGWTFVNPGPPYNNGLWVDPAVYPSGPPLPDGDVSHGGAGNLYLSDHAIATLDVSSYNLGYLNGRQGFQLMADIYIPNLRPLAGFNYGYPGNMNHNAGIGATRNGDGKEMYIAGDIFNGRQVVKDRTWDNVKRGPQWIMEDNATPDTLWWDKWITVAFDYNFSTPGKFNAAVYIPWSGPVHTAGWQTLAENIDLNPGGVYFSGLKLGSQDGDSWTQAQFDNVRLTLLPIPEPVFFQMGALIGMGGLGLLRLRRKA